MKATLDRYISSHYEELYRYTRYFCSKYNPKLTIDTVISNAYLHCLEINDNTEDVGKVKSYILNSIKRQVIWKNVNSFKDERILASEIAVPDTFDDGEDLNYKIAIEQQYQGWKSSVDIYRDGLTDNVKIAVAKAYFDKGLTTARSMAQYFNIPVTSAHYLISDIKSTLKSIHHENKR